MKKEKRMKAPTAPYRPRPPIAPEKTIQGESKRYDLGSASEYSGPSWTSVLEARQKLAHIPDEKLSIGAEIKCGYYDDWSCENVFFSWTEDIENPHYDKAYAQYKKSLEQFKKNLEKYNLAKKKYDEELAKYLELKKTYDHEDDIELREHLKKRIKQLDKKIGDK